MGFFFFFSMLQVPSNPLPRKQTGTSIRTYPLGLIQLSSIRLPPTVLGLQTQQPRFLQNGLLLSSSMGLLSPYVLCFFQLFFVFCFTVKRCAQLVPFKVFLFSERSVQGSDFRGSPEKTRVSDKSPHRHRVSFQVQWHFLCLSLCLLRHFHNQSLSAMEGFGPKDSLSEFTLTEVHSSSSL